MGIHALPARGEIRDLHIRFLEGSAMSGMFMQRVVLLLLLAFASTPRLCSADNPKTADPAKSLLGAWKDQENVQNLVWFEPERCTFTFAGNYELKMGRAAYEPGKITIYCWGRKVIYH